MISPAARLYSLAFDKQQAFIRDPSRKKALRCPRRAGKSRGDAIYLLLEAERHPGSRCLYIGLTRDTAKRIMWDALKSTARDGGVECVPNETELTLRLANGSVVRLMGLDANQGMAEKVLGDHYRLIILDEAASFRVDLRGIIKTYLDPATQDDDGTIAMTGTPDPYEARGFFHEVTTGKEPGWTNHRWSTLDNPYMARKFQARLDEIAQTDPLYQETDEYRCMYLGEWPREHKGRVYQASIERNVVWEMPASISHRIIAVDLGWTDPSAIVELGWQPHDPVLYALHAEKASQMHIDEIAARVKARATRMETSLQYVVDGANQQVVNELRRRYGLPMLDAVKVDKVAHIGLMNADLVRGRIKVVAGAATALLEEWTGTDEHGREARNEGDREIVPVVWDVRALNGRPPRRVEDSRCSNHLSDAATYGWRLARAYREQPEVLKPTEEEKIRQHLADRRKRLAREQQRAQRGGMWR